MSDHKINVTLAHIGVNMGDHAETYTTAVDADPDMTVRELVDATLYDPLRVVGEEPKPEYDNYVVLRLAKPIEKKPETHAPVPF